MKAPYQIFNKAKIFIKEESDIVIVRQEVRKLAEENGFNSFAQSALITAASELSRNIWTYAGVGEVLIQMIGSTQQVGMQIDFEDKGPGIADVKKVLAGGYSTAKSLGLGISGSKRLVDEFGIESSPDNGTKIMVRKWKRKF